MGSWPQDQTSAAEAEGRLAGTAKRDEPKPWDVNLGLNKEFGQRVGGTPLHRDLIADTLREWRRRDHMSKASCVGDRMTDPFNTYLI